MSRVAIPDHPDAAVRDAGCDDAQIVEIVQRVALNNWTQHLHSDARTDVGFPGAPALAA